MSRQRCIPIRAKAGLGLLLLAFAGGVAACSEDSKTVPERCADPALPLFDIQEAKAPDNDNKQYPCSTPVGHAVSSGPSSNTGGSTSSATGGGTATADAGAGGAP